MIMNEHTKNLLQALIDGKQLEYFHNGKWDSCIDPIHMLYSYLHSNIRVKPNTIKIGDMEVPAPEKVAPALHTAYWYPILSCQGSVSGELVKTC